MEKYIEGLVSVIMPTYKRSEKLIRAIDSVLNQSYQNLELLLVNDNEPNDDYTALLKKRVAKYQNDPRFYLILQERHINGAVARNVGINAARGEYIAFLDDDDWWEVDKLQMQIEELKNLPPEWGGISCRIKRYNNDKLIMIQPMYKEGYVYKEVLMLMADYETGTLLLRHTALDNVGYFDPILLRHQDLQLLVNFTYNFKLKQVNALLHCRDVSDAQNRPNVEKIIDAKKAFFESVQPILNTLTAQEKRVVFSLHRAEIGYIQLKNHSYVDATKNIIQLLLCPTAFLYQLKKIVNRKRSKVKA
ncbi:glycosyltransferase family 2 protein [Laedolimicola sp.]|uniref:glycosyltransferase family 2 protein n=1 Tax=Laedolimicola sp. TaxID=2981663 RepID=UPI003F7FDD00